MIPFEHLKNLRKIIRRKKWPITIEEWPNDINTYTNCAAYSLGLTYKDKEHTIYGNMISFDEPLSEQVENILDSLLVNYTKIKDEKEIKNGNIVIIVYTYYFWNNKEDVDFHFIQKDKLGRWVHKEGWALAPEFLKNPLEWEFEKSIIEKCMYVIKKESNLEV